MNPRSGLVTPVLHQLISIFHEIYDVFDTNPSLELRGFFLDISKAFDRVQYRRLLQKCICIDWNFLKLIETFLSDRYQRVILNG